MVDPMIPASRHTWEWRRHPAFQDIHLTRGERAADRMRNGMGSWPFVGGFLLFMALWAVINTLLLRTGAFDRYPYILLNLFLSMVAGLQGAILLIAAKRQDQIASALAQHDFETNVKNGAKLDAISAALKIPVPADTLTVHPDETI